MPLQATSGAASQDAFGGNGVAVVPTYIEEVFSTWLYTGSGSGTSQTITNNIDLSTKGGLVWGKVRTNVDSHYLFDTARGVNQGLSTNSTAAQGSSGVSAFTTTGFTVDTNLNNTSARTFASWTFRKQPKFFDIVTWTGNGSSPRAISHSLNSTPGCIIVKAYSSGGAGENWTVYHRMLNGGTTPQNYGIYLNTTAASAADSNFWSNTAPTGTQFTVGGNLNSGFGGGVSYVAYIFAHDAGGFGLTGTDNVISCGSFTTDGSGNTTVSLGYEPQWVLIKLSAGVQDWILLDNMRGMSQTSDRYLFPNLSSAEGVWNPAGLIPTATGFNCANAVLNSSATYIYIAIRRGPMAVPTTGTSVFAPLAVNNATGTVNTTGFPVDLQMQFYRPGGISPGTSQWIDRLRGFSSTSTDSGNRLYTTGTEAEAATAIGTLFNNTGFSTGASWASVSMSYNNLRRAPSFMDVVCYTGTGSSPATQNHNLGVIPEFILTKKRSAAQDWYPFFQNGSVTNWMQFFALSSAAGSSAGDLSSDVSATTFSANTFSSNNSSATYVAYLFATCAGVSKVGKYTGTGTTLQINCGFTAGARFVLIKRTDSTGDWYVWDSARGIVAGNDPYLLLNSTAAEVTNTDYVDTYSAGFEISSTAPAAINASGGNFVFLAIA